MSFSPARRLPRRLSHARRRSTQASAAAALVAAALLLTGCQGSPAPTPTQSGSNGHAASSAPSSTPNGSSTPQPKATAVKLGCDQVMTADQLKALTPPLSPATDFEPAQGSDTAKAVSYSGIACGYANATSGNVLTVSVARPAAPDLTAEKNRATTGSNVVPTYGVPPKVMGYFTIDGGVGIAQAFVGNYWVVAASKDFAEPGDAAPAVAAVLANLPR